MLMLWPAMQHSARRPDSYPSDFTLMLVVIGAVAASAGILSPIVTYWISSKAGKAQGAELGKQTATASLGAAIGSAAGGLLFNVAWLPGASFLLVTALAAFGVLLSLGLPKILWTQKLGPLGDQFAPAALTPSSTLTHETKT